MEVYIVLVYTIYEYTCFLIIYLINDFSDGENPGLASQKKKLRRTLNANRLSNPLDSIFPMYMYLYVCTCCIIVYTYLSL